jgi:hypothetical protein
VDAEMEPANCSRIEEKPGKEDSTIAVRDVLAGHFPFPIFLSGLARIPTAPKQCNVRCIPTAILFVRLSASFYGQRTLRASVLA